MSWRDFATAPRDGTAFIVCTDRGIVGEAYWHPDDGGRCCWANTHPSDYPGDPIVDCPRLWQPLPAPPAELRGAR